MYNFFVFKRVHILIYYRLYKFKSRLITNSSNVTGREGVTKKRRLPCLTNSALVYEPKCGGRGFARYQPMSTAVHTQPK
jgi:hypothetical protein